MLNYQRVHLFLTRQYVSGAKLGYRADVWLVVLRFEISIWANMDIFGWWFPWHCCFMLFFHRNSFFFAWVKKGPISLNPWVLDRVFRFGFWPWRDRESRFDWFHGAPPTPPVNHGSSPFSLFELPVAKKQQVPPPIFRYSCISLYIWKILWFSDINQYISVIQLSTTEDLEWCPGG